jgi:2-polyprenyl-6-hydroxyphenyl methylase / 3-demethylubiquinone-9 3-methyltransferase
MRPSWYRSTAQPPPGQPHSAGRGVNADEAELDKFSEAAQHFWDPRGEFRPLHALNPARAQFVRERAQLADAQVLDVGCGGGLLAETLAGARAQVIAIDLSPAMIAVARAHAAERALVVDYRLTSAEALAASDAGRFDVVTCMEMLEHVPDPAAMVATLAGLVRPGGQLFVSTVHRNLKSFLSAIVAAEYLLGLLPRGTHEFERFIRPAELARWARAAGLELREVAGLRYDPLTQHVTLTRDPSVNYLAHLTRA